jgi:histidyl-tRNA synthetase
MMELKDVELRLSHAGLIKALLGKLGLTAEEQHRAFDLILDGDTTALAKVVRGAPELEGVLKQLLSLKGQSPDFLKTQRALIARSVPGIETPLDDFLRTVSLLDDLGIKYHINITSGAGFEYYTGIIFQFFIGGEKVGGGGRYDALIPSMGGGEIPASGFALYVDSLLGLVKLEAIGAPAQERIVVRTESGSAVKSAFETADRLRRAGYIAEIDLDGKKSGAGRTVEVGNQAPAFTLVEKSGRMNFGTIDELLKGLGSRSAD